MFELGLQVLPLLMCAAFVAGFIDAIAGGGGLITVPALLLAGASPIEALGTNKVQGMFGSGTAAWSFARRGHVNLRQQLPAALTALIASATGAALATWLPTEVLRYALPVVMVCIALFFAFKPGLDDLDRTERMTPALYGVTMVPMIGGYDGLFGPGAGSFYMIAFVTLAGYGVLKATAHTKLLNFASNIGGLLGFALAGAPLWATGLLMGLCQMAGARLGSALAMRIGARVIKPLLVVTSTSLAIKLLWDLI